ncbi:signal peptidase, endoplasmic reticulum-type [Halorubrum aquaticum]|uniref:Signal peptidase, endoplasmic reticulum-type n=1 Tax=Halorubrum aquaticum TaxID=387340 RepID=A0A1I3C656_9EURY|nr:signal peptidase, endoplasmic reticulum-type [Halorubrum aquaticum]
MDPEDRPASSGDDPTVDGPAGDGSDTDDPFDGDLDVDPDGDDPVGGDPDVDDPADAMPIGESGSGEEDPGLLYRFRHDMNGPLMWLREMLSSVAVVLLIGLILFAVSGVWPPMVAVESPSMEPNMNTGDLVFVTEPGRLAPDVSDNDIGVVTHEAGEENGYRTFGDHGSVVIYQPPGRQASPIIHRAMFHVEEGENWYDRADDRYHNADGCAELRNCPAPHAGFVTLGDNNQQYDQANGLAEPVAAEWVTGVARIRVPYLGYVRLITTGQAEVSDVLGTVVVSSAIGSGGKLESRSGVDEGRTPGVESRTPSVEGRTPGVTSATRAT